MSKYVLVADIAQLPGSLVIGDDPATDTLTVNALLTTDLVPDGDGTRSLGSPSAQWKVHGTVIDGITENFSQAFEHTLSGSNEYFTVWTYIAADYVGGTMKVYVKKKDSNNYGIAEYLFLNSTTIGGLRGDHRDRRPGQPGHPDHQQQPERHCGGQCGRRLRGVGNPV